MSYSPPSLPIKVWGFTLPKGSTTIPAGPNVNVGPILSVYQQPYGINVASQQAISAYVLSGLLRANNLTVQPNGFLILAYLVDPGGFHQLVNPLYIAAPPDNYPILYKNIFGNFGDFNIAVPLGFPLGVQFVFGNTGATDNTYSWDSIVGYFLAIAPP